jgi:response regulator NasT
MTRKPEDTKILIAEDEAIIRMDLKEMLEEDGYTVVAEASDGRQAIDLAREHKPDLCILDIKMPGMDGIRAAEVVTRERLSAVLILTAFSQRDLAAQAAQAGAMAYLVKPFQKSDLMPAIEVALQRYREVSELEGAVGELSDKLEERKLVERAKGMLMEQGLTEAEAYRLIQRAAMDRGLKMNDVAQLIIDGRLADAQE